MSKSRSRCACMHSSRYRGNILLPLSLDQRLLVENLGLEQLDVLGRVREGFPGGLDRQIELSRRLCLVPLVRSGRADELAGGHLSAFERELFPPGMLPPYEVLPRLDGHLFGATLVFANGVID